MKRFFKVIFCLSTLACFTGVSWTEEGPGCELVQRTEAAKINWTEGILSATGKGVPPEEYHGNPQGRKIALAAAVENARHQLLTLVEQIPIDAQDTVGDLAGDNEAVLSELKDMIEKAEVVHQEFSTDGSVAVTIQMSMNGGFAQLMLPTRIKQIEPVKPIPANRESEMSETDTITPGPYTGMIVDVRGITVTPCMVPRVCDENGKEIFGSAFASREFAVQHGMTGYLSDLSVARENPRVADRPLILKGLRTAGVGGTDIVVSNTDAARLRSAFENLAFLRQCRVLIVMDLPDTYTEG